MSTHRRSTRRILAAPKRGRSSRPVLRSAALLGTLVLVCAVLLSAAAGAGAVVLHVGSANVGLQPRNTESFLDGNGELGASFANESGNPVVHANSTYTIYWDPTTHYHSDWQALINGFLADAGSSRGSLADVFDVSEQYTDRSNAPASPSSAFKGAYIDSDAYPASGCTDPHPFAEADQLLINNVHVPVCLTDAQVQQELQKFIAQHNLPKGMGSIFYLLTPPAATVCLDAGGGSAHCSDYSGAVGGASYKNSFCSYHSDINPGGLATGDANTILYGAIPWTAGGLGDKHLLAGDRRIGFDCQDGGFDPSSTPSEGAEHPKEKTQAEKEAFEKATNEEKAKLEEAEAREGPRAQEPNQGGCPSFDGGCDRGLADLIINQVAVEQQDIVTNPLLNAWQDAAHNEASDECRDFFAPIIGEARPLKKNPSQAPCTTRLWRAAPTT